MYAILETGGKQYRVSEGDTIKIENISGVSEGAVTFDNILMVSDGDKASFGTPFISSAKVTADVVEIAKDKKILVFKQKTRKNHRKLRGHRQQYTAVKIKDIKLN